MSDECRPMEVDGETLRVRGDDTMTPEARAFFAEVVPEIIRAARRRYLAEHEKD